MLRFVLIGTGLLSLAGLTAASAADMSAPAYAKAPMAAPVAPYNWTGCYIGGHLGGAVSQDTTIGVSGIPVNFGSGGFVGGGQIGCDYQFSSGWVVGAEGRAAWTSLQNTHNGTIVSFLTGATAPSQFTLRNDYLASATARLGHTFNDRWLLFVRGGAAWTDEKIDDAFINFAGVPSDPRGTLTRTGWTAGVGVEWMFAAHWSASLEYNYYDFGNTAVTLFDPATVTTVSVLNLKDKIHAATIGVNYHF